jgi:hypothetical protein
MDLDIPIGSNGLPGEMWLIDNITRSEITCIDYLVEGNILTIPTHCRSPGCDGLVKSINGSLKKYQCSRRQCRTQRYKSVQIYRVL